MSLPTKGKENLLEAIAFAGAGLVGLATQVPVRDFVDAALALRKVSGSDTLGAVSEAVLGQLVGTDREVVVASVRDVLAAAKVTLREAVEIEGQATDFEHRRFTGERVAAKALADAGRHLVGLSEVEVDEVARVVAAIYRAYLGTPGVIESMQADAISAIFGMESRMRGVERRTADVLRGFALDGLLEAGVRPIPHRLGPDSWLLRPEYGVVPFHAARRRDVEALLDWAESADAGAIRLVHGRGGAGKTRLAAETVDRLRGRGWAAGFLADRAADVPHAALAALLDRDRTFVAVDYAETRRPELEPMLAALAGGTAGKSRVLLISRSKAEWWDVLSRSSQTIQRFTATHASFMAVSPLSREASVREQVLASAATSFARALDLPEAHLGEVDLSDDDFGLPLFVNMAALAATRGRRLGSGDELLDDALERERRFWDKGLEAIGFDPQVFAPLVAQAVALLTAIGGCRSEGQLARRLAQVPLARGLPAIQLRGVAHLVSSIYPMPGQLGALGPDLVGEHLVATELAGEPELFADALRP